MTFRTVAKNLLNYVTHPLGINIIRHFGEDLGLKQIDSIFKKEKINVLLDVGANTGQYAVSIFRSGFDGKIISFEPLHQAYESLKKKEKKYKNWTVYERSAIGDFCGKTTINVSENSHSSSILPISEIHMNAAPSAKYISSEEISISTLDSIFEKLITPSDNICLKIDTQGFEDKVLKGAFNSLKKIKLIQIELSLIPLYDGGKTIQWMLKYLDELGFTPLLFFPGFIDRKTEQIQQLEALFIKKNNG